MNDDSVPSSTNTVQACTFNPVATSILKRAGVPHTKVLSRLQYWLRPRGFDLLCRNANVLPDANIPHASFTADEGYADCRINESIQVELLAELTLMKHGG